MNDRKSEDRFKSKILERSFFVLCRLNFNEGKRPTGIVPDKFSYAAIFKDIQRSDFNLNIPRYVDTFGVEAEVDIVEIQEEIDKFGSGIKICSGRA